ncbi:hypothetical protein TWF696_005247 [Orbilia brochopaga]|uniref:Rad4-domain-containing protein n=1 Tax=Orbilia brochopaga TaxID=3140254 RepID=A0AAV9V385_9PEZI
MAKKPGRYATRKRTVAAPQVDPSDITSEEHARKRRRIERGFRRAIGQRVSDHGSDGESESDDSSTEDLEIEERPRQPISDPQDADENDNDQDEDDDDDDAGDWENILETSPSGPSTQPRSKPSDSLRSRDGDVTFTLDKSSIPSVQPLKKKGVSSRERSERLYTHIMHVICLLYHGYIRNVWINDNALQELLLGAVKDTQIKKDVDAYLASFAPAPSASKAVKQRKKGKGKNKRKQRPATPPPEPQELPALAEAKPDTNLLELLSDLMQFWKGEFKVTAPGLRKKGYLDACSNASIAEEEKTSEKICGLEDFRQRGKDRHGSRDVGAQLFTALLRALGLETRLIFSLCPLGYGFTKVENRDIQDSSDQEKLVIDDGSSAETSADSADSGSDASDKSPRETKMRESRYDRDIKFPTFWTEVYSPIAQTWIAIDPFATGMIISNNEDMCKLEPKGQSASKSKQQISYVVAYNMDNTARDVTVRYLNKRIFPGKTKGFRMPLFDREILDHRGDLLMIEKYDLFSERILRCFQRNNSTLNLRDLKENQELLPKISSKSQQGTTQGFPTSVIAYKNHPKYILERHLKREECVLPGELPVHTLVIGKGDKAKEENVYSRSSITTAKPAENWYKEGRVVKPNQTPLKHAASRAVMVNRKREIENARREGDENAGLVGLYAFYQTELYRPAPISDGIIPRNAYGNIDCFVPSMIPEGAVHVPYRNAARLSKRLGIEYAEAITGFEFKNKRAIPRADGVLCTEETAEVLIEACKQDEEERRLKEEGKREQVCLKLWKKFLIGLRIVERIEEDYGDEEGFASSDTGKLKAEAISDMYEGPAEGDTVRDYETSVDNSQTDGLREPGCDADSPSADLGGGFIREDA